jgi:hypothetical protein
MAGRRGADDVEVDAGRGRTIRRAVLPEVSDKE